MQINYQLANCAPHIFRAYDIRGIVDEQLSDNLYFTLGVAIANILKKMNRQKIVLAWDGRLSSAGYARALGFGLHSQNIEVLECGMVPTAIMYYATSISAVDCGLMVTGSHNPKNYNGLKIVLAGNTLASEGIQAILAEVSQLPLGQTFSFTSEHQPAFQDFISPYVNYVLQDIKIQRPLKIVVDYGHGVGGVLGPLLFENLGCEVFDLYQQVDGHFPAHHPDPTVEKNLGDLKQAVKIHQADIGIAFDGDADRLGVVTADGDIIWPDRLMMIFAQELLQRRPGACIVYDVKCSKLLAEVIENNGGQAVMSPTGHSLVKAMMKQRQAELAGEMSGHIFFKDRWYGFDDGIYSACRFLEILSHYPSFTALLATLPAMPCSTPELQISIAEEDKFQFIEQVKILFSTQDANLIDIDGVRLEFPHGWGLLRASNTSPCLVSRFEANNQVVLAEIQNLFRRVILSVNPKLELPF